MATINGRVAWLGCGMLAAGAILSGGGAQAAGDLLTGRAVYDLDLAPSRSNGIVSVTGTRRSEYRKECDRYFVDDDLSAMITGPSGVPMPFRVVMRSIEADDHYDFEVGLTIGTQELPATKGSARRSGGGMEVRFVAPDQKTVQVTPDAVFPTAAIRYLLDAASRGERFGQVRVFDGSSEDIVEETFVIGPPGDLIAEDAVIAKSAGLDLGDVAAWRVTLSYFPPGDGDQAASGSLKGIIYDNGAMVQGVIDFGFVVLGMKLTEFKAIPARPCPAK
jgi:hypothetical protein